MKHSTLSGIVLLSFLTPVLAYAGIATSGGGPGRLVEVTPSDKSEVVVSKVEFLRIQNHLITQGSAIVPIETGSVGVQGQGQDLFTAEPIARPIVPSHSEVSFVKPQN